VRFKGQSYFNEDGSRTDGAGDGLQRLREQDEDNIDAELLYAPVFAVRFLEHIADKDAYLAMVQAYNTWLAEYMSVAPDRLIGNALMPVSGIDDAIAELNRAHEMGFKSVQLVQFPNGGGAPKDRVDDAFWERALELDMALSPHMSFGGVINTGGARHDTSSWPVEAGMTQHSPTAPAPTMAQMIVNGTFDRIPELRFYFAEINAAIFPASLYYMDRDYLEYNSWFQLELPRMPSEYMKAHGLYGMVREPLAVRVGAELPEDMPLDLFWWGSDFPHSVGTFPRSREYIDETFGPLDEKLRHKLLVGNAAEHLHLDLDADITETPVAA